jgi:hypothetical protein
MPDTTWPIGGHPPGSSRDSRYIPVPMSPVFVSTRHQRFASARLPDPHLTHQVRLSPHRSPRQSSANAAVGGLKPPPAGRLRRAYLHLPRSTASRSSTYIKLLSAFVTHTCPNSSAPSTRWPRLCLTRTTLTRTLPGRARPAKIWTVNNLQRIRHLRPDVGVHTHMTL